MTFAKSNRSPATFIRNRVEPAPMSGICVTCLDGCPGPCEIGRSALRGREMLYPQPFGKVTAGSEKDYPVDFSHFNIQGTCVGAPGISADPDKATFPAVDISTAIGAEEKISLKAPFFTGALDMLTYFDRLKAGLQQLMAGARKFALPYIGRDDLCSLTRRVTKIFGIHYVMESDQEEVEKIWGG